LIILDLSLPGISGVETAGALQKLGFLPQTPLIIATALGEDARPILDSFALAALLSKPFKISVLLAEVEAALCISARKISARKSSSSSALKPAAGTSMVV
jgi:DNA-binding response OmpR family regulator